MGLSPSTMFFRLLLRSVSVRRGRSFTAALAITVAATLATALMTLYSDIGEQLRGDFRGFGANVVISAPGGFNDEQISAVKNLDRAPVMPSAFAVAQTSSGKPVVVVGTELSAATTLNPAWQVTGTPDTDKGALVGVRAAALLVSEASSTLQFGGKSYEIANPSSLRSGGPEDSRIYIPLTEFERWTGLRPTVIEAQLPGTPEQIAEKMAKLRAQLPSSATVQPVRQIVEAETRVLGKTRFILSLSVLAITLTVALCVLATLTASVMERRKDYAVMKALGSSQAAVNAIFLGETTVLAAGGAMGGYVAGCALAMWIGRANFHATIGPRLSVFPAVLGGCVVMAMLSALLPLVRLQNLQPAAMLKGD